MTSLSIRNVSYMSPYTNNIPTIAAHLCTALRASDDHGPFGPTRIGVTPDKGWFHSVAQGSSRISPKRIKRPHLFAPDSEILT